MPIWRGRDSGFIALKRSGVFTPEIIKKYNNLSLAANELNLKVIGRCLVIVPMRVAVLFLRLLGIGLLLHGVYSACLLHSMQTMTSAFAAAHGGPDPNALDIFGRIQLSKIVSYGEIAAGVLLTLFAARACRLLTFDVKEPL